MVPSPEITAVTIEVAAPVTNAPYHRHPYQRLVYVLDGELGVQTEGGETKQYPKGSLLIEMRDLWHRPVVTSHAKLLVIDFAPRGEPNQITRQQ